MSFLKKSENIYGGQALIEGVMFAGKKTFVSAVIRNDDSIDYFEVERKESNRLKNLKKIPFLRGLFSLVQASSNGVKHLDFASDRFEVDPKDDEKVKEEKAKETSKLALYLGLGVIGVLTFIMSKVIFTVTPALVANLFEFIIPGKVGQVFLEGFIKLVFLLVYIYLISLTPMIKRVFQYHGAEHKIINAYENNLPITVENVQKQSRLHYRCGSSFILFTVIVGVFVYMFVATDPLWWRVVNRIILIPVVIGISFEVLQLTNKVRNVPLLKALGYPGLWLQLLTTKEPDEKQVLVGIHSFKRTLENDGVYANYGDTVFDDSQREDG